MLPQELSIPLLTYPSASLHHYISSAQNYSSDFHSHTHSSLCLGPGLLREDKLYPEILSLPAREFLTPFLATHSCILTSDTSSLPYRSTFFGLQNALLPIVFTYYSTASVYDLAPLHCRRRDSRPVSYYALFKCMAASKPTSWLFLNLHLLSHLVIIWDLSWWSGLFPF